jgi:hypothetical protein
MNTIFEDTRRAVLFQNRGEVGRFDLTDPRRLADLLNQFYSFAELDIEGFETAVDEMLIQHLLTERLFRKIFHDEEFTRRNVIAAEVEKVIGALAHVTGHSVRRG